MSYQLKNTGTQKVGYWLLLGVFMIFIQVILGGITRLTGSGLSITEWDVIKGTLPPLNLEQWTEAFNKYKQIPQYEVLNEGMSLAAFKKIYFWEYIHRFWGRVTGLVFFFPFVYFISKRYIKKEEIYKYIIIMILAAIQAAMGWIMVASGLEDRVYVDPVKLMLHLFFATVLLIFVYRLALENLHPPKVRLFKNGVRNLLTFLVLLIILQICVGGLVAGSKAALAYPTWPKMGNVWIPGNMLSLQPAWLNLVENFATIQFIHRTIAYILVIYAFYIIIKYSDLNTSDQFHRGRLFLLIAISAQLLLGILTVMNSKIQIPVALGVLHQLGAMILLLVSVYLHYIYKYK
jgi:cytochrome c oxidase assembly protein subunit 15